MTLYIMKLRKAQRGYFKRREQTSFDQRDGAKLLLHLFSFYSRLIRAKSKWFSCKFRGSRRRNVFLDWWRVFAKKPLLFSYCFRCTSKVLLLELTSSWEYLITKWVATPSSSVSNAPVNVKAFGNVRQLFRWSYVHNIYTSKRIPGVYYLFEALVSR